MSIPHPVARYYDRNTRRFLRFGRIRGGGVIHRALWAPGVTNSGEAGAWIHGWIGEMLRDHGLATPDVILDMGCGVGGTLVDLARTFPEAELHGVTISTQQVKLARQLVGEQLGPDAARLRIHAGDFDSLDLPIQADAVVAIEAFVHSGDAGAFFRSVARHLAPGGLMVLVDDFLTAPRTRLTPRQQARVRHFERGWHLGSLCTVDTLESDAAGAGLELVSGFDFTHWTRPGRPRDRVIAALSPAFRGLGLVRVPFFANMIGGDALQDGLREGFIRYRGLVLRRSWPMTPVTPVTGRR
ncbi:MAG: methyltransferase domain-containing protein [Gemmatimonadales bacterium]|nr:MAG: methyltransferase domain-containing protein [Gemmatimonadales bacterium]